MNALTWKNYERVIASLRKGERKSFYIGAGDVRSIFENYGAKALEELCSLADVCVSETGKSYMYALGLTVKNLTRKVEGRILEIYFKSDTQIPHIYTGVRHWAVEGDKLVIQHNEGNTELLFDSVGTIRETKTIGYINE